MQATDFFRVTNAAADKAARIDLFGEIGGGFWSQGFDEAVFASLMRDVKPEQPLDIVVNSPGGSVFTALAIYNLIGRHKGPVTITVAGMAASATTIITSAKNARVVMPTGSMMLVHPVRVTADAMTPDELRAAADNLEKVRQSVRDVYVAKTGLDPEALDALMGTESYLTPREAKELGFCDEVDESTIVENSLSAGTLRIGGLEVETSRFPRLPKALFQRAPGPEKTEAKKMNLETLRQECPELVEALIAEGAAAERARIQAIEEVAMPGHEDLVRDAKFVNAMTAEQLAVAILKADRQRATARLAAREEDARELSGLAATGNLGVDLHATKAEKEEAERKQLIEWGGKAYANT